MSLYDVVMIDNANILGESVIDDILQKSVILWYSMQISRIDISERGVKHNDKTGGIEITL